MGFYSFDDFYDIQEVNKFIDNLKTNKIPYRTYISIKPPHNWFYEVSDKYKPVWLKYDEIQKSMIKFLMQTIIPIDPSDEKYLRRTPSTPKSDFEKFISPNIFKKAKDKDYVIIFRYKDLKEIQNISKELGIKIFMIGKMRGYNLAMCFNKYVKNYVFQRNIIIEKTKKSEYSKAGELEYALSEEMRFAKLVKKTRKYPYVEDGSYHPLNKTIKYAETLQ